MMFDSIYFNKLQLLSIVDTMFYPREEFKAQKGDMKSPRPNNYWQNQDLNPAIMAGEQMFLFIVPLFVMY